MIEPSTPIGPDPTLIERFVNGLFAHAAEGGIVSLRAFYDDELAKRRDEKPFRIRTVRLNGAGLEPVVRQAVRLAEEAAQSGRPVVVAPPIVTFADSRASEKNLLEGLTLSIELDEHPSEGLATLRGAIGQPTMVVASGGLWCDPETGELHDKLHVHYRLAEPTQTQEEHDRLKRARTLACDLVGADGTSKTPVHPMRWAGTLHRKNPGAPRLARIVEQHETEVVLEGVLAELQGLAELRAEHATDGEEAKAGDPTGDADLLMDCADRIANADLDWAEWNRLGMAFYRASDGQEAGFTAFDAVSRKSRKYDAEATRARWEHYDTSPPSKVGIGTLVYEARKADPGFRRAAQERDHATASPGIEVTGDALFNTSHDGLALDMGKKWHDARHVALWGSWLFWTGCRWERDEVLLHMTRARDFLRTKGDELVRWAQQQVEAGEAAGKLVETCEAIAKQLRSAQMVANVVGLARSNPTQAASVDQWDADPFKLGLPDPGRTAA
jgi:hypothetical protein